MITISDYNIKVGAKLDVSSIQAQFKALQNQNFNINAKINMNGSDKSIASMNSQMQNLIKTAQQMGKIQIKMAGLDPSKNANQITELNRQLSELQSKYKSSLSSFQQQFPTSSLSRLNELSQQAGNSVASMNAKMRDTASAAANAGNISSMNSQMQNLIKTAQQMGKIEIKLAGLDSNKNANQISELTRQLNQVKSNFDTQKAELSSSFNVTNFDKVQAVLKKTESEVSVVKAKMADASNAFSRMDASTAGNRTLAWLKQNSKAASEYGEQLKQLAVAQKNSTNANELNSYTKQVREIQAAASAAGKTGRSMFEDISGSLEHIGIFVNVYSILQSAMSSFKEGVQFVISLDDALTNVNYTMDVTSSQLSKLGTDSVNMAKDLSTSATNVLQAITLYANANETTSSILNKAKTAIELSNVTGMSGTDSSHALQSIMNQFDMSEDDLTHISDVVQNVSQNMAHDFSKQVAA